MKKKVFILGITILILVLIVLLYKPVQFLIDKESYLFTYEADYQFEQTPIPEYFEMTAKPGSKIEYLDCRVRIIDVCKDETHSQLTVDIGFEHSIHKKSGAGIGPEDFFMSLTSEHGGRVTMVIDGTEYECKEAGYTGMGMISYFLTYKEFPEVLPDNTDEITVRLYDLIYTTYTRKK